MAIQIVSENLIDNGDNGNFEIDRSAWGNIPDIEDVITYNRALGGTKGLYACRINVLISNVRGLITLSSSQYSITGKKYRVRANVKCTSYPSGSVSNRFALMLTDGDNTYLPTSESIVTVGSALIGYVALEAFFTITAGNNSGLLPFLAIKEGAAYVDSTGGEVFFLDDFNMMEYIDVVDPCTLVINTAGTVVVNESTPGANNGSIAVAVNGGTTPFEYSKDGGSTWQLSNSFTGLAPGIYTVVVREQGRISCNSTQTFAVNQSAIGHSFTTAVTNETVLGAGNGSIAVTVSGTGGPFTFSKDGGVTYQSGNVFTGLAPGTYTIVVRNAALNILAANATVLPGAVLYDKIYWSKNPIPFAVQAPSNWASLTNLRMYCEVLVEDVAGTGTFVSKMKMSLYPASNGECLFNLRQALRSVFKLTPPTVNSNSIVKLTDRAKAFKVITDTMEGDVVTPTLPVTTSNTMLALYGGLSTYAHAVSNFFTDLSTTKKFLTWQPANKLMDSNQEDYLNFLVYSVDITTLKLQGKAYFDDGTTQTAFLKTQTGVKFGDLYQIPVGTANSGVKVINAAKNLIKYEISLLDQANSLISEVRTFNVAAVTHPLTRFIMMVNSLGAHEVHRMTGETKQVNEVTKELVQKYLPPVYDALQGEFENTEGTFTSKTEYSTGMITQSNAAEWQSYFTDLLLGKLAYETVGGKRYPLAIVSDSVVAKEDRVYGKFVRFEAINSFIDKAYTPQ